MAKMGNTCGNGRQNENHTTEEDDSRQDRSRNQAQTEGRSNVVYHILLNRGSDSSEIRREVVNLDEENDRGGEEESSGSDDIDDEDLEESQLMALQIISRMLGIGGQSNLRQRFRPHEAPSPDPFEKIKPIPMDPNCDLYRELQSSKVTTSPRNVVSTTRALHYARDRMSHSDQMNTASQYLPKHCSIADFFESRVFCGEYSTDGNIFICSPQDGNIVLYDSEGSKFSRYKTVHARDVGWSVLSTSFSPDQNWFLYTTWSPCVHVCNVYGENEHHYSFDLHPDDDRQFCVFYAIFSPDNKDILAATSDGRLYIYDRERNQRTLAVETHQDDSNGIAFCDSSGHIVFTTGDDGLCKAWDRRLLTPESPRPVGIFAGHKDGITFVDSKNDGRYLITNSKDQSIKLWDIRKFSSSQAIDATLNKVARQAWDYRWEDPPRRTRHESLKKLDGDTSIMTYAGHSVKNTLIRCRFSPAFTTGQRYIYTGCANGRVVMYDVLTGEIISKLQSSRSHYCVRDVSWNPYQVGMLMASAWDGMLQLWSPDQREDCADDLRDNMDLHFW